ncbi:hypothetical protein PsYK624_097830 [Phanerochaete sordida]|uniref:Uncharacterized protein n=1 Tax=Phanerochaete sordida TaxID=48140 RepID=A0A9P3GEW8_9APHY|nr:hypothetical protein PsYK624_097830 [Phanerochaete sordida]
MGTPAGKTEPTGHPAPTADARAAFFAQLRAEPVAVRAAFRAYLRTERARLEALIKQNNRDLRVNKAAMRKSKAKLARLETALAASNLALYILDAQAAMLYARRAVLRNGGKENPTDVVVQIPKWHAPGAPGTEPAQKRLHAADPDALQELCHIVIDTLTIDACAPNADAAKAPSAFTFTLRGMTAHPELLAAKPDAAAFAEGIYQCLVRPGGPLEGLRAEHSGVVGT